ncbi:hypothetical protein L9G74_20545, partial [Shewanella sp. C32]
SVCKFCVWLVREREQYVDDALEGEASYYRDDATSWFMAANRTSSHANRFIRFVYWYRLRPHRAGAVFFGWFFYRCATVNSVFTSACAHH